MKKLILALALARFAQVALALAVASTTAYAADRVAKYDFDKDGKVSFEEVGRVCNISKALFERADSNGDGFLSNSEMRTAKGYLFGRCEEKKDA